MTSFRLKQLQLTNYRCFETLDLTLEDDLTVLFAENGGGKSALLTALAMGLAVFQRGAPGSLKLNVGSDPRQRTLEGQNRREPVGPCTVSWAATSGSESKAEWSTTVSPASGRTKKSHQAILGAMEQIRVLGDRWPLFAWYGVDRMGRSQGKIRAYEGTRDRWEAYASSLDPSLSDAPLLEWLKDEMHGDVVREQQGEPKRFFDKAVMEAAVRATPGVSNAWYDPAAGSPMVRFETGHVGPWAELSDGYHVFLALVADIARRAMMLNEIDGAEAPERLEGVVIIDEIDLHLHPRWQRVALPGLRKAFPRLQFIVSTHSPQVLSSAENRQVRLLMDGKLWDREVLVTGRDTNAILAEYFGTDVRDKKGTELLDLLDEAIDAERGEEARKLFDGLLQVWGNLDTNLIRRRAKVERLK